MTGESRPITDSNTCGMDLGDYLELMVIYTLTHRLDDETVSKHHPTMARLQSIRERNAPSNVNAAIQQFHRTRRKVELWKTTTSQSAPTAMQSVWNHNELNH
jgi:hypothetical protein